MFIFLYFILFFIVVQLQLSPFSRHYSPLPCPPYLFFNSWSVLCFLKVRGRLKSFHLKILEIVKEVGTFFFKDFVLFLDRGEGRWKEEERNISVWFPLVCSPLGTWLQPRHVPWLGIEPATLWFMVRCSIHWATSSRAEVGTF